MRFIASVNHSEQDVPEILEKWEQMMDAVAVIYRGQLRRLH